MNIEKKRIVGADEDTDEFEDDFAEPDQDDSIEDSLDDIQDTVEDMQDDIEDIQEDDVTIDTENNIAGHYIAECDNCKGVFISAVIESDQDVESITGECPICGKNTAQYLKWIIKEA